MCLFCAARLALMKTCHRCKLPPLEFDMSPAGSPSCLLRWGKTVEGELWKKYASAISYLSGVFSFK